MSRARQHLETRDPILEDVRESVYAHVYTREKETWAIEERTLAAAAVPAAAQDPRAVIGEDPEITVHTQNDHSMCRWILDVTNIQIDVTRKLSSPALTYCDKKNVVARVFATFVKTKKKKKSPNNREERK